MKHSDLYVGMGILWKQTEDLVFSGTVSSFSFLSITISFSDKAHKDHYQFRTFKDQYSFLQNEYTFYFSNFNLNSFYFHKRLSKEERINQKCKHLWNNSNWVKSNPSLRY